MPLKLDNEGELREAQMALFNINSASGWIMLEYVGASTVHFSAGGEGGPEEVIPHFDADRIQIGNIEDKGTLGTTVRDVMFCYIGPNVGIMEKGKKNALLGDAQAYLQPYHADITVLNKEEFTRENIIERSHPLSGSHVID